MNFWKDKKVLVTGHTGFKGAWLSLWLTKLGAHVSGYSLDPNTNPSLYEEINVDIKRDLRADIRDCEKLLSALSDIEIVFHLAAQPLVAESYKTPLETMSTNIMGTVNLLEAMRQANTIKSAVIITTDKCYENLELSRGYRETDRLGGHDPYAASKACAEIAAASYRNSFNLPVATARAGNVIGGGDWAADRLIPDIVRAWSKGDTVTLRRPEAIRPWQHVLEPLCGYIKLSEALYNDASFAEAWNFGPYEQDARTVGWVTEQMKAHWGEDCNLQVEKSDFHETNILLLDSSKAIDRLWKPKWTAEQAVEKTALWYKKRLSGSDPTTLCMEDIESYEQ